MRVPLEQATGKRFQLENHPFYSLFDCSSATRGPENILSTLPADSRLHSSMRADSRPPLCKRQGRRDLSGGAAVRQPATSHHVSQFARQEKQDGRREKQGESDKSRAESDKSRAAKGGECGRARPGPVSRC